MLWSIFIAAWFKWGWDALFSISQFMGMGSFTGPGGLLPPLCLSKMNNHWLSLLSSLPFLLLLLLPMLLFLLKITVTFHSLHLVCEHCGPTGSALPSVFMFCGGLKRATPMQAIPKQDLDTFLYGDRLSFVSGISHHMHLLYVVLKKLFPSFRDSVRWVLLLITAPTASVWILK